MLRFIFVLALNKNLYFSTRYVVIQREAVRPSEESRAWGRKRRSTWAGRCRRGQQDVRRFLAYARNDNGAVSLRMSRKAYLNTQPCHSEGGRKAERRISCMGSGLGFTGRRRCGQSLADASRISPSDDLRPTHPSTEGGEGEGRGSRGKVGWALYPGGGGADGAKRV